ncbi:hypothetical protein C8Q77DRAFT_1059005 [Trametes polyzona]|nr:hypothetical protein C8Q77DRAFT_1059005 [Trametes polyzona]
MGDTRLSIPSAGLPDARGVSTHVSGRWHNPAALSLPSSEVPQRVDQRPSSPPPYQVNAGISKPEKPAYTQQSRTIRPPQPESSRRSLLADCSEITSPPNSAPIIPPVPRISSATGSDSVHAPKAAANVAKRQAAKAAKGKGRKKEKALITPLEYAKKLQAQFSEQAAVRKKQSDKPFLRGKRIFYYGGDLNYAGAQTRNRMEIITRHGGILVPEYDPSEITHIVTDADEHIFLRAIGLKKLSDIPQHIPTVKWSWVLSGFDRAPIRRSAGGNGKGKAPGKPIAQDPDKDVSEQSEDDVEYPMDYEFLHASFKARIDAGRTPWGEAARLKAEGTIQKKPSTSNAQHQVGSGRTTGPAETSRSADDISNISEFTQDRDPPHDAATILPREGLPSPPSSPGTSHPGSGALPPPLKPKLAARTTRGAQLHSRNSGIGASGSSSRPNTLPVTSTDPLAEFYATARAEREAEMLQDEDAGSGREAAAPEKALNPNPNRGGRREVVKKGFICDDKGGRQLLEACPNQDVIDKLQELKALHAVKPSKDDEWRVIGYNKAIAALRKYPTRISSYEEAVAIRGVGDKTAQKIMEIIETGGLRRIEHERTGEVASIKAFMEIYGVGKQIARKWYNNGCRTLEDVAARKGGIKLTAEQEIGLKYHKDINTRIPRAEVQEIYDMIKAVALRIDPELSLEIMGSFRRGKLDCGDIDILITRPTEDGRTHRGVLKRLLVELHRKGILTEDLCLPEDFDDLELVYRGLCRKDAQSLRRRIDILAVPWRSRGAARLYYTGDDIFNRSLRLKAQKMGYSLNQRGLYEHVVRDPRDRRQKLNQGKLVASETEEEIFEILGECRSVA